MSSLIPGPHAFTATYLGDENFAASTSAPITVTVRQLAASTFTLVFATNSPTALGQRATFTAAVIALGGASTPTGTVAFIEGITVLGTAPLSGGVATFSTTALAAGPHAHRRGVSRRRHTQVERLERDGAQRLQRHAAAAGAHDPGHIRVADGDPAARDLHRHRHADQRCTHRHSAVSRQQHVAGNGDADQRRWRVQGGTDDDRPTDRRSRDICDLPGRRRVRHVGLRV